MAASRSLSRRAGSGSRTLPPARPGRSAAYAISMSPLPAIARRQTPTARLNGSVGASLAGIFGLILELMIQASFRSAAKRQTRNPYSQSSRIDLVTGIVVPAFAGTTLGERDVDRRFRQLLPEATLIEFRHQRTLQLIALVHEGQPEGEADIVEDIRVLRPGDHRARAHDGGDVAVHECVAGEIRHPHHLADDVAALGRAIVLRLGEHDFDLVVVRQIVERGD